MRIRPLLRSLVVLLCLALIVGCDSGCATSKPFAAGVKAGVPRMERDLRHFAGADPLRIADVEAFLAATADDGDMDVAVVERTWSSVKVWYLPAIDLMSDPDARALRQSAAGRLDKLIADEKGRPLRPGSR